MTAILQLLLWLFAIVFFLGASPTGKILGAILGILGFLAGQSVGIAEGGSATTGALFFAPVGLLVGALIGGIQFFVEAPVQKQSTSSELSTSDVPDSGKYDDIEQDGRHGVPSDDDTAAPDLNDLEDLEDLLDDEPEENDQASSPCLDPRTIEVSAIVLREFARHGIDIKREDRNLFTTIYQWILEELHDVPDIRIYRSAINYASECALTWESAFAEASNDESLDPETSARVSVLAYLEDNSLVEHDFL